MQRVVIAIVLLTATSTAQADDAADSKKFQAAWNRREKWLEEGRLELLRKLEKKITVDDPFSDDRKAVEKWHREVERIAEQIKRKKASRTTTASAESLKSIALKRLSREMLKAKRELAVAEKNLPSETQQKLKMAELRKASTSSMEAQERGVDAQVSAIRNDLTRWPPLSFPSPQIGDVGKLPAFASRMPDIVALKNGIISNAMENKHNARILQVIDEGNSLVSIPDLREGSRIDAVWLNAEVAWLRGVDTSGFVDGQIVKIDGQLIVSGTKQYETQAGAAKTVRIVEPFDVDKFKAWLKNRE